MPLCCALALLLGWLVAGCASPGGAASTHNDVTRCAAVLPLASEVVRGQGTLTLVRPINRAQIDTITRETGGSPPAPAGHPSAHQRPPTANTTATKACLVTYRGSYQAATIPQAQPPGAHGQYALIVLWVRHPTVDRILITDTLPADAHGPWWHF